MDTKFDSSNVMSPECAKRERFRLDARNGLFHGTKNLLGKKHASSIKLRPKLYVSVPKRTLRKQTSLAFEGAGGDAVDEVALEEEVHDQYRECHYDDSGEEAAVVVLILSVEGEVREAEG